MEYSSEKNYHNAVGEPRIFSIAKDLANTCNILILFYTYVQLSFLLAPNEDHQC